MTPMSCHSGGPSDVLGRRLRVGDAVLVVGEPDLTGLSAAARAEFAAALAVLRRGSRRIAAFDARGNAEFTVRVDGDLHTLALEPGLLEWTQKT